MSFPTTPGQLHVILTPPGRTRHSCTLKYHSCPTVFISNHIASFQIGSSTNNTQKRCDHIDLHNELVPYAQAWSFQKGIVKQKRALIERNEECPDTVITLQHPSVYTLGTASSEAFLNFGTSNAPYDVFRTERGGEVTYHGPGQLVMYPIINLRNHKMDLHWYLRALEEVILRALLSAFAIKASRLEGFTGVWVGDKKLAAIGIRVSQWITYHGLALNVSTDLTPFEWIVPCGIRDRKVGSIKELLEEGFHASNNGTSHLHHPDDSKLIDIAHKSLLHEFSRVFQLKLEQRSLSVSNLLAQEKL